MGGGRARLTSIGIGIVGAGYMGKAHAVAMNAVAAVFDTAQRPSLEILSAISESEAQEKACAFGFRRGTADWRALVEPPEFEAVVIASPQWTPRDIALAAFALGKPVLCEKPLGESLAQCREMTVRRSKAAASTWSVTISFARPLRNLGVRSWHRARSAGSRTSAASTPRSSSPIRPPAPTGARAGAQPAIWMTLRLIRS